VDDLTRFTGSLHEDLTAWNDATAAAPLNKHASQVAGIVGQLTQAMASLPTTGAAQSQPELEQTVGDYTHIWDFFRSKFMLRYVPWYQPLLGAADDLAWAAFQPVRDLRAGRREPPLVYFSRDVIPFTVTRGQDYQNLLPRGGLWSGRSEEIASSLVVPVISLPWQRFSSLSVLLAVAHEVGHVVVSDLELLPVLSERLANAGLTSQHQTLWSGWLEEVFADIFSAVVCGGTVALALTDQLGTRPDPPATSAYPPVALRARLIMHTARRRADLSLQPRVDVGPAGDQLGDLVTDVEPVVAALLDAELPPISGHIEDLYSPVDGPELLDDIDRLTRGHDPQSGDIRVVLAAAAAVELTQPDAYHEQQAGRLALRRAAAIRDVSRRARETGSQERDRQAGSDLAAILQRSPRSAG
jgi:hypothetical protein